MILWDDSTSPYRRTAAVGMAILIALFADLRPCPAQVDPPAEAGGRGEDIREEGFREKDAGDDETDYMKPTSVGIRMTPQIAGAMGKRFSEGMKERYDLDADQVEAVGEVITRRLMRFSHENEASGQAMFEMMMATMIEHDGRFPRETAQEFAQLAVPFVPKLQRFVTDCASDIGHEMGVGQRLKFTGDLTAAAAGITVFQNRMKRWQEGRVGDNANPFWDPADDDPSKAGPEPSDPNETPELRRARLDADRWMQWRLDIDGDWNRYVQQAAEYYAFDEAQRAAAEAVLKDCRGRLTAIKSDDWQDRVRKNRVARSLIRHVRDERTGGPWLFALEMEFNRLEQPLTDLDRELKKRIDGIPNSDQRAAARQAVRELLAERGMKDPPI
jgi:hypothetical protein